MKVLITDPITEKGLRILSDSKIEVVYLPNSTLEEKNIAAESANAWIIRSGTKITSELIRKAKNLSVIGRAGVGIDNIDINEATRRGVVVMNTPDGNTIAAAEHTIAMMLALSRNIHSGHNSLEKGEWNRHQLVGTELQNKILGVVGLGKIGISVQKRCLSFGMKIIGSDPYVSQNQFDKDELEVTDLETLVKTADFITVHVPLTQDTRGLFDYSMLTKMKKNARIINVARGGIIDENDLCRALKENKISGAAIDVFESEPINLNHPLVGLPNALLTPHLGASTLEAKEGVSTAICTQIRDYLTNERFINVVNMRLSDLVKLKEFKPHHDLSRLLGQIQFQLGDGPIDDVQIKCFGAIDESRTLSMAFLKGLLEKRVPERINYINAEVIAKELKINLQVSFSNLETNYTNLISTTVISGGKEMQLDGSVFDKGQSRLVNINGFDLEVKPQGTMLLIKNIDVPGVIGRVGTFLGTQNINIGAYILSRRGENNNAFSVVSVDSELSKDQLKTLSAIDNIESVKQVIIN